MKNILKLYQYISDERNRLIWTAVVSTLLGGVGIAIPLFFRYVIDTLTAIASGKVPSTEVTKTVILTLLGLAAINILRNGFGFIQERLTDRLGADIEVKLHQRIFSHMMDLSIDYYEQTRVGETLTKTQNALYQFAYWLKNLAEGTLTQIIQLFFAVGLLIYVNTLVGLVVTVLSIVSVAIQMIRIRRSRKIRTLVRQYDEQAGGHLSETISHISTIRSSVAKSVPTKRYEFLQSQYRGALYEMNNIQQYGNLARGLVNDLAGVLAISIITWQAIQGRATPGDVVAVALYLQQITSASGMLGRLIINTSEVESSVERIIQLLETAPTVVDAPDAVELEEFKTIEFKNVSFAYPGKKRKVLENITFTIMAGETIALVGPSGTGKTTITKLLLRFYEPTDGQILINGRSVDHFTAESIRRHIGMVMQDVALFNETVEANLQLANPRAALATIKAAATQAHANVFIDKLPEKYKTMVGERGVKLSGGEKQRVAIARAILKEPSLIILDEATSALDSESEQHVQAGLHQLMDNRTAVIIAHRLSTVMSADQILVLRNGKIVERGTHADLADKDKGLYAKLFKLQSGGFERKIGTIA